MRLFVRFMLLCVALAPLDAACSPDEGGVYAPATGDGSTSTGGSLGGGGAGGSGGAGGAAQSDYALTWDGVGELCSVDGNPGECMDTGACAALDQFTSNPGYCNGPANIQCCAKTP